ncbi:hypothetical protein PMI22_04256 [Pseudomonas sp. GM21]|jgi:hypothetical protein|nr:hypothetical protein PMI22_04256 [Pseudomonas sp. GM21]
MGNCSAAGFESVQLGILLGRAAALKNRLLDRQLLPLGITAAQLKVLRLFTAGMTPRSRYADT